MESVNKLGKRYMTMEFEKQSEWLNSQVMDQVLVKLETWLFIEPKIQFHNSKMQQEFP